MLGATLYGNDISKYPLEDIEKSLDLRNQCDKTLTPCFKKQFVISDLLKGISLQIPIYFEDKYHSFIHTTLHSTVSSISI